MFTFIIPVPDFIETPGQDCIPYAVITLLSVPAYFPVLFLPFSITSHHMNDLILST